jgi:hypothetical protein
VQGRPLTTAHHIVKAYGAVDDLRDLDLVDYTLDECETALGFPLMPFLEEVTRD